MFGRRPDEYLTKPIRVAELFAALGRMKTGNIGPSSSFGPGSGAARASSSPILDLAEALVRVGDQELLKNWQDSSSKNARN